MFSVRLAMLPPRVLYVYSLSELRLNPVWIVLQNDREGNNIIATQQSLINLYFLPKVKCW